MPVLETPSRIWRRIEQNEANNDELPSLPSVSDFDSEQDEDGDGSLLPNQSTPPRASNSLVQPTSSGSTERFANSILRASRSSLGTPRGAPMPTEDSFDVSRISYTVKEAVPDHEPFIEEAEEPLHSSMHSRSVVTLDPRQLSFAKDQDPSRHTPPSLTTHPLDKSNLSMRSDRVRWNTSSDESRASSTRTPSLSKSNTTTSSSSTSQRGGSLSPRELSFASRPTSTPRVPGMASQFSPGSAPDDDPDEEDIASLNVSAPDVHVAQTPARFGFDDDRTVRRVQLVTPAPARTPAAPADSLTTPSMHRREFLMSLVQSTARPGLNPQPTPQPIRPFMTPRSPHPLSQVYTVGNTSSDSSAPPGRELGPDDTMLSTGSSHDLTVHRRANASFDPATAGRGTTGTLAAAARFDQQKLNTYLHALNRQLTEENRRLTEQLGTQDRSRHHANSILVERSRHLIDIAEPDAASETFVNAMTEDLAAAERETAAVREELAEEKELRAKDGEAYQERLANVQQGVESIIADLESQLEDARTEARELRVAVQTLESERDVLVAKAERADARAATRQDQSPDEAALAQDHVAELRVELANSKKTVARVEGELFETKHELETTRIQVRAFERKARDAADEASGKDQDLRIAKTMTMELQAQLDTKKAELTALQDEREIDAERIKDLEHDYTEAYQESERLKMQLDQVRVVAQESEAELEKAEQQLSDDAHDLSLLKAQVAQLQREDSRRDPSLSRSRASSSGVDAVDQEELDALRADLDAANAEIGRLKFMSGQTTVRGAIAKAKDARLTDLERRNEELEQELAELNRFVQGAGSISKANITLGSTATPMAVRQTVNRINDLIRTPKTPGPALRDPSWAGMTTGHDSLFVNIANIQQQLNAAEAELGVVNAEDEEQWGLARLSAAELRRRLRDANGHIAALRAELLALQRAAEHLEREHQENFAPSPPKACAKCVQREEEQLESSPHAQAANGRLHQTLTKEQAIVQARTEAELDKARSTVARLRGELDAERTRLARLATEQNHATEERDNALRQLRRTRESMEGVKDQLDRLKQENRNLEGQVHAKGDNGQHLSSLEQRLSENQQTIETLRADRELLMTEHDDMHLRYKATTERLQQLRDDAAAASDAQATRLRQFDTQAREIDDLKAKLARQTSRMQDAQARHEQAKADRDEQLADLAQDLREVKAEAHNFGRELEHLRQEKAKIEAQRSALSLPVTQSSQLEKELSEIKTKHNQECKGLFLQIQYLKSKFTRETLMRGSLTYQKGYLLVLLGRFERRDGKIVAAIARIGFPNPNPKPTTPRRRLRGVAFMVVFMMRVRKAATQWRAEAVSRQALYDALEDVRRRRVGTIGA